MARRVTVMNLETHDVVLTHGPEAAREAEALGGRYVGSVELSLTQTLPAAVEFLCRGVVDSLIHDFERTRCGCETWLACGGTFRCGRCGQEVGWCQGAHDDMPDDCNRCWAREHDHE